MKYLGIPLFLTWAAVCSAQQNIPFDSALVQIELWTDSTVSELTAIQKLTTTKGDSAEWNRAMYRTFAGTNHFAPAIPYGKEALAQFQSLTDTSKWKQMNDWLVTCYMRLGGFDEAIGYCQQSFDLAQVQRDTASLIQSLSIFSWIFHDIAQYERGVEYGKRGLNLANTFTGNSAETVYWPLNMIAINFDDWSKPDSALHYHFMNLDYKQYAKDTIQYAQAYNNIGNTLRKTNRLDESRDYLQRALLSFYSINDLYNLATVYTNLGSISHEQDNLSMAQAELDSAEQYANLSNSYEKRLDIFNEKYLFHKDQNQLYRAMNYLEAYHTLKDSVLNIETNEKIAFLEVKFDSEKKEQTIELQQAEISIQHAKNQLNTAIIIGLGFLVLMLVLIAVLIRSRAKRQQALTIQEAETKLKELQIAAAITSQESERKRFARDLHDGFGQMISVLNLNLKSLETEESSKEEVFEKSSKILEDMYTELKGICFNLMPETLIRHGVPEALEEFAGRINRSGQVIVKVYGHSLKTRLSDLQEISIYRISQEWINNILKYSDADKVSVSLTRDKEELTLLIEDNGMGFDCDLLTKGKGSGWKNINSRANLIKGELDLDTVVGRKGNVLVMNATILTNLQQAELASQLIEEG